MDATEYWILPFYRDPGLESFKFGIFFTSNPQTFALLKSISEQSNSIAEQILNEPFGVPYEVESKVSIGAKLGPVFQTISANIGSVVSLTNPVFPVVDGMLFQDFATTTAIPLEFKRKLKMTPRVTLGSRRLIVAKYTSGEILTQKPKADLFGVPPAFFAELSLQNQYLWNHVKLLFEINSLPLTSQLYAYWNTNFGIRSKEYANVFKKMLVDSVDFYFTFSPFYAGDYDMGETFQLGTGIKLFKHLTMDVFWRDFWYMTAPLDSSDIYTPGLMLKLRAGILDITAFAYHKMNYEYEFRKTQIYGFNLQAIF